MSPPLTIRLAADDGVAIARTTLLPGAEVAPGITASSRIPAGHKVAIRPHEPGAAVRRYGQIIGFATAAIAPGEHVHVHNLGMGDAFARDYAFGRDARPTPIANAPATFQGIRRADGRAATRNYIGVLTTVNCSAHVAGMIADMFKRNPFSGADPLAEYPNIDGVVALTHKSGCGMTEGEPLRVLRRTLAGYARHVNFSHVVVLGLGCEINQIGGLIEEQRLAGRIRNMDIQAMGGTRRTVEAAVGFVREVLAESNRVAREPVPASELTVALQCGGSDGYSGITANPALGAASDLLSPWRGGDPLGDAGDLRRRASADAPRGLPRGGREAAGSHALVGGLHGAGGCGDERQSLPGEQGRRADHDPGEVARRDGQGRRHEPGRRGALRRAGDGAGLRVHGHARLRSGGGDGAGGGGCEPVCFTTGRGSVFGCKPAPSIKLATNTPMFRRMTDDMDINCGTILDGEESVQDCGRRIFETMLRVASGERTKSESFDFGAAEFAPWQLGATM